jgi:hypothetical protein
VIGGTTRSGQPRQQTLLFEKQQQKTLVNLGHRRFHQHGSIRAKVFCVRFFKKALLS